MAKVFVTRPIPENGMAMLKAKGYDVQVGGSMPDADAIVPFLNDKISAEDIAKYPNLKIIASYSVGFNHIDLEVAKQRNIFVTNTPGTNEPAVAEYTIAAMLDISRRLSESDRATRAGKFTGWGMWDMLGDSIVGKTLGVVGIGRIGSRVAEIATKGFDMQVIPIGPEQNLDAMLPQCDFVSLHVPLLDSTRHLINEDRLKLMKATAFLINSSRGPVVDEEALIKALKEKWIAGVALDVYEFEPKISPELLKMENVLLTPHIAAGTKEVREKMAEVVAVNIIEALEGRTPPNVVS